MKKKIISAILTAAIIISSFALSLTAFASSQELKLNVKTTTMMSGVDDLEWFYFTPEQSGIYSFMSFNVPKSDGYLFIKEIDPETNRKEYKQLAYAPPYIDIEPDKDKREEMNLPHYNDYGRNVAQFCLTYHLEAGTRYYFAAGWYLSTQTRQQFDVMLVCDSYDNNRIESVEVLDMPDLTAYTGGEWRKDKNGKEYFHYFLSEIEANTTIKINYLYGDSVIVTGKSEIDDCKITYYENQNEEHWYPENDLNYSGNRITVRILDIEAAANVNVDLGDRISVYGKVVNLANQPVENAVVSIDGVKTYTNADGIFNIYSAAGYKNIGISTDTSIDLDKAVLVSADSNDLIQQSFILCNCDFVKDGYVNAKDYSYIIKNYSGEELDKLEKEFQASINFSADEYEKL